MASTGLNPSKSSKWFFNKSFKLTLTRPQRKSDITSPPLSPSPVSHIRRNSWKGKLKEVFQHFDGDGDGKISSLELKTYFASIGEYMSLEEAQTVINDLDMDGDGLLDFGEFKRLMERDGADDDLKRAFEMFEAEKGSGCITPKSLQRMLNRLGDEKSFEECEKMIRVYDLDENGMLDFQEFHQMMT